MESRTVRKEIIGAKIIYASFPLKVSACLVSSGFAAIILKTWMLAYSITGRCSLCGRALFSSHNLEMFSNTHAFAEGVSGVHCRGRRLTFYFAGVAHRCNLVLHKCLFVALNICGSTFLYVQDGVILVGLYIFHNGPPHVMVTRRVCM